MEAMGKNLVQNVIGVTLLLLGATTPLIAQLPDHPIITEVFNNATGNDGPTGHNPANPNQEFLEILLPTAANLSPALNKDALNLTYYEIEGDSNSSHLGWVNQRFDLPTFDLDPSNGTTPGAVPRPSSGVVVLGWVDYNAFNPPTDLAGTPGTRIGLINNGITVSPAGTMFIAINGAQFTGTTNFQVPVLESRIDIPNEHVSGVMKNGSNAYLLVNRDDPGFAALVDHSAGVPTDAGLPGGLILGLTSLLDGIAGNDDTSFVESLQPFAAGSLVDLATVLPLGGVFTPWVAQIAEGPGTGYARKYVDVLRTTEDGVFGNEDPALDAATNYRDVFRTGPFFPTPGAVTLSTSPPELGVPLPNRLQFNLLADTTGRPGLICANVGGDFPIDVALTVGASDNPALVTFAVESPALAVAGQQEGLPQIRATAVAGAPDGAIVSASVTFSATNTVGGDPAVVNPVQGSTTSAVVLKPIKGIDALGAPIETTVFAAVQGFGADVVVLNEFLGTDLATFVAANLGTHAGETVGNLATLLNPTTDLEDFLTVDPLRQPFPSPFINAAGAPGTDDLVTTLLTSAKVASGSTAYDSSVSTLPSGLKAIAFSIPETSTFDGMFSPSEQLCFADAVGAVNLPRSGLSSVTTGRTFELALIDTNVTSTSIESGDSDDFGIIVRAGQVTPTASVVSGEFIFLSYTGGLEGEDIDTLDVPGVNATVAILLDLDNLHDVLGVETITQVYVVDADLGGTVNVMEVLSLNRAGAFPIPTVSAWGLGIMFLSMLTVGTLLFRRRWVAATAEKASGRFS